jgi:hypothetical protein
MIRNRPTYKFSAKVSAVFLILALAWLTVSTPFVYAAQQANVKAVAAAGHERDSSDDCNPFGNTTEEKAPSGSLNTLSEEYLHHDDEYFHSVELVLSHTAAPSVKEYTAFHGELICPPPDSLS